MAVFPLVLALMSVALSGSIALAAGRPLPHRFFGINASPFPTAGEARQMAAGGVRRARFQLAWNWVQPPLGTPPPAPHLLAQCSNFRDDDGDGRVDGADPGCSGPFDDSEADGPPTGGTPGPFGWGYFDSVIQRLAQNRIRALPTLVGTPAWIASDPYIPPIVSGRGQKAWHAFVKAAVARYGSNGAFWRAHRKIPYEPIRQWQIWNEPNYAETWHPAPSPRGYVKLLRVSAHAIRSVDPHGKVVLGGLGPGLGPSHRYTAWGYLDRLYRDGGRKYFDIAAIHPYASNVSQLRDQVERMARVIRRFDPTPAPLSITELGWSSDSEPGHRWAAGSEKRQASLLVNSIRFLKRSARRLNIDGLFWFDWKDISNYKGNRNLDFGLRRQDGSAKPSYYAYKRLARK